MKLISPCCTHIQDYAPKTPWDGVKRRTTRCKLCKKSFDITKNLFVAATVPGPVAPIPPTAAQVPIQPTINLNAIPPVLPGPVAPLATGPQIPTYSNVNVKKLVLNWSIHQVMTDSRFARKGVDILSKDEFLDQGTIKHGVYWTSDLPPYERPDWLFPWQKEAMAYMDEGHLLWQASRQLAAKTTATIIKDIEDCIYNPDFTIALTAPTVPLTYDLIHKTLYNPIKVRDAHGTIIEKVKMYDVFKPYFLGKPNQDGIRFKNNSQIKILSLNRSGSQGRSIDVIHIEELDKLGPEKAKRQGLAGIINSVRANPDARVRIACNNASGEYYLLRDELFKFGKYFRIFVEEPWDEALPYTGRHNVINEQLEVKQRPQLDQILKVFGRILVSFEFAERQLYNTDTAGDETFNPEKLRVAYKQGQTFQHEKIIFKKHAMGIDPGGKRDKMAITVWGITTTGRIVCRWIKQYSNRDHVVKVIAKEAAEQYIRFQCEQCGAQMESNAGMPLIVPLIEDAVREQSKGKIRFKRVFINFADERSTLAKGNFIMMFKILFDLELMVLFYDTPFEQLLKAQFTHYIPNKQRSNDNQDDLVESCFHAVWKLLGGFKIIKMLVETQDKRILMNI